MPSPHKKSFAAEQLAQRKRVSPVVWVLIGAAVIILIVGGYVLYRRATIQKQVETKPQQIKSIAVLPFDDLSPDHDQEWFSDGITDDIIFRLQQIRGLKVISRTSSVLYRTSDKSLLEIGKDLDVATILEGTVRRIDNRVKITVQLIDAQHDAHLWANQYERDLEDIYAVQGDIARAVVDQLKITLAGDETDALAKQYTDNLEAYELYLLGKHYLYDFDLYKALDYYLQAIEADPGFALAYSGISSGYSAIAVWTAPDFFHIAKAAGEKAIALDSTCAEAYESLASVSMYYDWDWNRAENMCKRAIELNPGYELAHKTYHEYLMITGQEEESLAEAQITYELNPQFPIIGLLLMDVYGYLGRYDEAMEIYRKYKEAEPDFAAYSLGRIYVQQGRYDEAIKILEKSGDFAFGTKPMYLAYLYAISGNRTRAQTLFDDYIKQRESMFASAKFNEMIDQLQPRKLSPYLPSIDIEQILANSQKHAEKMRASFVNKRMVWIYTAMGDYDRAFECLDRLSEIRGTRLPGLMYDPEVDSLHDDPRFTALRKKMGLE